jgi:putative PEP-CTERM system TPR-repeat lipoprotein
MTGVISAALLLAVAMLSSCGGNYTDIEHVQRAKEFRDDGNIQASIIELKNALQKNLDNPEARWLLGEIYLEVGDGRSAQKELARALELGVSPEAVIPVILKAMIKQNDFTGVLQYDTSAVRSDHAVAEILSAKGVAHMMLGDPDKAKEILDRAIRLNEASLFALVSQAQLSMMQRRYEEMEKYLETALALDENHAPAWSLKADYAKENQDMEQAVEAYSRAVKYSHDNGDYMLKRALLYIQIKRYDDAQKDINSMMKRFPNQSGVHYAQGMYYFYQEKFSDARVSLEEAVTLNPQDAWSTYYLGVTHFVENNHEQALTNLGRFVNDMPGYVPARKLLAYLLLREGQYGQAESLVRPVLAAYPDDIYAMNILASALLGRGESAEAMQLLERAVALNPDSPVAQMNLGVTLLRQDKKEGGIEYLERAIDIDPGFDQAQAMLAMYHLKQGDVAQAIGVAESFVNEQPDNAFASTLAGRVYLVAKRDEDAIRMFTRARELSPGDAAANSFLAAMAMNSDRLDEARKYYREILSHHENDLLTLVNLAILDTKTGDRVSAKANLEQAINAHPSAVHPRTLLAREYLKEGRVDRAGALIADIMKNNQDNPTLLGLMGDIQLAGNEFEGARSTLARLARLQPQNASAQYKLAMAYDGLGDKANVTAALAKALELAPDYALAKIAQARLSLGEGDLSPARQQLATLKSGNLGDHPATLALEGEILAKAGEHENALAVFRGLYEAEQTRGNLRLLSRHLWRMGKQDESMAQLEAWVKAHPDDIDVTLELANGYLGAGREASAVEQYRQILKRSENNLVALNNLAWYLRASEPRQSLIYAEKAHALAPESVSIMDTLASSLLENGETERALRMMERALAAKPGDPALVYRQAIIMEKLGRQDEARDKLRAMLDGNPQFPEKAEAEQLLIRLGGR